ncbi:signal transduction histidine kinase-like protein [Bifidobacterium pseudolongum subsp. globosum]|uniref:Signal transduction histidine kinase-like protein n=1 Tax=Bifidobacterium pseudolongum subsp. globosum TaxID=1690 RepID=A0A4Q5A3Z6_9BIFI|nr:hypothetical protein [Bifidobacterium pseudolongum]RYQ12114.1 signal transduction histidine kinase-like protein [Bifidobacterium pseudolongum subsp. globosum]
MACSSHGLNAVDRDAPLCATMRVRAKSVPHSLLHGIAALWTVLLALDSYLFVRSDDWGFWCIVIVEIASVWLLAYKPLIGVVGIGIVWCLAYTVPIPTPSSYVNVGLTAVGVLGYLSMPFAVVFSISFVVVRHVMRVVILQSGSPPTMMLEIMMLANMLVVATAGFIVRTVQKAVHKRAQQRRQHERLVIVSGLHDVACNNLVYALLLLRQLQAADDERAEQFSTIAIAVDDALMSVQAGIHLLQSGGDCSATTQEHPRTLPLQKEIEQQKQRVHVLGFDGLVSVEVNARYITANDERMAALDGLIHELFGNLVKYGDSTHPYVLTADVQGDVLRISWCNTRATQPNIRISSGSGIAACTRILEQCGGTLSTKHDGDVWCAEASMPVLMPVIDIR